QVDVSAYSFEAMRDKVFATAAELEGNTAVNITCGTKVMALGAFDVARNFDLPVFYLDSRDQRILLLQPGGPDIRLPELLTVKTGLAAHGYRIDRCDTDLRIALTNRVLTETLVNGAHRFRKALATVNYVAQKAKKKLKQPVALESRVDDVLAELLDLFAAAGLLAWDRDRCVVVFDNEQNRVYVNGGWLEEYCKQVVAGLKKEGVVYDLMANVHISNAAGTVKNELDLALTARNRLHLIECKTAKLTLKDGDETKGAQAGYKLDTLRDVTGGSFARAMLVSFQPLSDMDRMRCQSYGISLVEAQHLPRLREKLLEWIRS
ncbi:MAG: DUF1887 family protein, partial [Deltaproteobacteria bacterium]